MTLEYAPLGLIGVFTPQANTTVEPEMQVLLPPGFAAINARLTSPKATIEGRLIDYYDTLENSLAQFANAPIKAVAVGCTGASYLVGREREAELVDRWSRAAGVPAITTGLAVVDALNALGARKIGFVSCYPPALTLASSGYWASHGFEIGEIAVQGVGTFHPEDSAQRRAPSLALRHQVEQVALISNHAKGVACPAIPVRQLLALVNGALEWAVPGCHGPQLSHGEVRDGVAVRGVGFVILARRAFGDRSENLERDSAFLHPGQVGVPASAPSQPVAFPEQGVRMEVGHREGRVKSRGFGGDRPGRVGFDAIQLIFDEPGQPELNAEDQG